MKNCIENIHAGRIISSEGGPAIETAVSLCGGTVGTGRIGIPEGDEKNALKAIKSVNEKLAPILKGKSPDDIYAIDSLMLSLNTSDSKTSIPDEALLSVSVACCAAAAKAHKMPLYRFIGGASGATLPIPMAAVIGGCSDIREFMIMPTGAEHYSDGLKQCCEVYSALGKLLRSRGLTPAVGNEGGYMPSLPTDSEAIELILEAISSAGFRPGADFRLALNADACAWKTRETGKYELRRSARVLSSDALIDRWKMLAGSYPITSIEDPLADDDWTGWAKLTAELGSKVQLIGGKLFSTDCSKLFKGIRAGAANAVLVKLSEAKTVSSAIECVKTAKNYGLRPVISHSEAETESSFISDFAVAINSGQIKIGAPSRGERTSKYNRLMKIEEELRSSK